MNQFHKAWTDSIRRAKAILDAKCLAAANKDYEAIGYLIALSEQEYARQQACHKAALQHYGLSWTNKGDFSHLQSTGALSFGK